MVNPQNKEVINTTGNKKEGIKKRRNRKSDKNKKAGTKASPLLTNPLNSATKLQ